MSGNSSGKDRVLSGKDTVSTSKDSVLRGNVRVLPGNVRAFSGNIRALPEKESVLFVCTTLSSFVKGDIEILQERYLVKVLQVPPGSKFKQFFSILREFLHLLFKIKKYRFVYIWFADYHSFLPVLFCRILNKPSYVVAGGYDVCRIKKVGYGSFVNPVRGFMTRYSFAHCTRCLCVSAHVERVVRAIAPSAKTTLIYNAISRFFTSENTDNSHQEHSDKYSVKSSITPFHYSQERSGILCVASASSYQGIYIKGIDRYIETARLNPDLSFTLVGCGREVLENILEKKVLKNILEKKENSGRQNEMIELSDTVELKAKGSGESGGLDELSGSEKLYSSGSLIRSVGLPDQLPGNIILYPRLEQKDLKELYIRNKVYCQLSRSESFGVAMAEAMYFNCIPVYTSAGGLKEVAGEYGFMVSGNDPDEISTAIKRAHSTTEIPDSRERIGSLFTYMQRAEKINDEINDEDFVIGL